MMKRIGVEGVKLTEYEMNIASHLVDPLSMKVAGRSHWLAVLLDLETCPVKPSAGRPCFSAGELERHSRSGRGHSRAAEHGHPPFSEKTSFGWIKTLSASQRYRSS